MVYCDGGDIYSKIKASSSKGKNFPETQIVDWLAQMALALLYLHERKILHRDMKTQNIFLKNGKVSISYNVAKVSFRSIHRSDLVILVLPVSLTTQRTLLTHALARLTTCPQNSSKRKLTATRVMCGPLAVCFTKCATWGTHSTLSLFMAYLLRFCAVVTHPSIPCTQRAWETWSVGC